MQQVQNQKDCLHKNENVFNNILNHQSMSFPPIQINIKTFTTINTFMLLSNLYVIFISSNHVYIIAYLNYLYGIRILTKQENKQAIKRMGIYLANLLIWYCQLNHIKIQKPNQIFICVILLYYFRSSLLSMIQDVFQSLMVPRPKFGSMFIVSQWSTLKTYVAEFIIQILKLPFLKVLLCLPHIIGIIQRSKFKQTRQWLNLTKDIISILELSMIKYENAWIVSKVISTCFSIYLDYYYTWDFQRINQGKKKYQKWIYPLTFGLNLFGRLYWIIDEKVGLASFIEIYRLLCWNIIRIQYNYAKNMLHKKPSFKRRLKRKSTLDLSYNEIGQINLGETQPLQLQPVIKSLFSMFSQDKEIKLQ